jgi:hypothetical protein
MPRFQLAVVSDSPERTKDALERAGIKTLAPFSFVPGSLDEGVSVEPRMTAVLDAVNEQAALIRVRDVIGDDCDIQKVRAEHVDAS